MLQRRSAESLAEEAARCNCIKSLICLPALAERTVILIEPRNDSVHHIIFEKPHLKYGNGSQHRKNSSRNKPFETYFSEIKHDNSDQKHQYRTGKMTAPGNKTRVNNQYQTAKQNDSE